MLRRGTIVLLVIVLSLIGILLLLKEIDGVYHTGAPMPLATGFSVDAEHVEVPSGRCTLVRVTSDDCPSCRKDRPQYERLVAAARQTNCSIVAVTPRVGGMEIAPAAGTLSVQYVDLAVGRALMPFLTPQTLLVDPSRRLVWRRLGALDDDDLDAGLRALGGLR